MQRENEREREVFCNISLNALHLESVHWIPSTRLLKHIFPDILRQFYVLFTNLFSILLAILLDADRPDVHQ